MIEQEIEQQKSKSESKHNKYFISKVDNNTMEQKIERINSSNESNDKSDSILKNNIDNFNENIGSNYEAITSSQSIIYIMSLGIKQIIIR